MSSHVLPVAIYTRIFRVLIALTLVTVVVAYIDLGALNPVAALAIAGTKAYLVAAYFMHLKFADRVTRVAFVTSLFGVVLLFALALDDELTRDSTTYLPAPPLGAGETTIMGLDGIAPSPSQGSETSR